MSPEDRAIIEEIAEYTNTRLQKHYVAGFGIFPTSDPDDNYYNQVWSRDFAHAAGNYFVWANPQAVLDSLETIFKHQKKSGELPFRVEREYTFLKIAPGLDIISKPLFAFLEDILYHRNERPIFGDGDTTPLILIAVGDFFEKSDLGKQFVKKHYGQIKKAADYFGTKCDPNDGLAIIKGPYPDWADTIIKRGKLASINIWWTRALQQVAYMSQILNQSEDTERYLTTLKKVRASILIKLYDAEQSYFKTSAEGAPRLSSVASIFGSYLLSPKDAARLQETLSKRTRHKNGLINFDPAYPSQRIWWLARLGGHAGYHNRFVWPWVTLQNIHVKIRIAREHEDAHIREFYKEEAIADLLMTAKLFKTVGGAYEIFEPDEVKAANGTIYKSARHFMANLAGYQGVYQKLKMLGWL